MPPKPFTLDSVLKFRKRQENLAQEKFIQAKIAAEKAQLALQSAKQETIQLIATLEDKQKSGIIAQELAQFEDRIQYSRDQIQRLNNTFNKKQAAVEKKRVLLLEKSKDHKVLDTLKEHQNRTWKAYLDKKEAAMLDEIAILHHGRNQL